MLPTHFSLHSITSEVEQMFLLFSFAACNVNFWVRAKLGKKAAITINSIVESLYWQLVDAEPTRITKTQQKAQKQYGICRGSDEMTWGEEICCMVSACGGPLSVRKIVVVAFHKTWQYYILWWCRIRIHENSLYFIVSCHSQGRF
jgi:hypothetical protein